MRKAVLCSLVCLATLAIITGCVQKELPAKTVKKELKTCRVSVQKVEAFIETTGTVQPDLEGGAKIISPLPGTVERILVRIGDSVRRGSPLVSVRSSDVSDAHSNYLSTLAQLKQAERNYELNKRLLEIGAVTRNDFLASEANYEQFKAAAAGLRKKLDIYGASYGGDMQAALIVRAPIDGRVVDIQSHIGDRFDTSTPLMTIANSGKSLIVANVYDTDISKIRAGRDVTFTSDIFPGETFRGTISYVSDVVDADSKTIKTYIKPSSKATLFKQNMFMKIRILIGEQSLPIIPKSAMIYKDSKFYVQLKKDDKFEIREVKPIQDVSDELMAVAGLREGDVIAGAAIDLEQP